jgi:hypothetical protein
MFSGGIWSEKINGTIPRSIGQVSREKPSFEWDVQNTSVHGGVGRDGRGWEMLWGLVEFLTKESTKTLDRGNIHGMSSIPVLRKLVVGGSAVNLQLFVENCRFEEFA